MLIELYCDKFKQKKTTFKPGLNVVLGDDNASNSIGKSTFLLAIDFVCGGDSYIRNSDVTNYVGHHSLGFCFKFGEELSYFKRSTSTRNVVCRCDSNYVEESRISITDFRLWLKQKYQINIRNISWRQLTGLYMRIYGKANTRETEPLYRAAGPKADDVKALMETFDKFEKCAEQANRKKTTADRFSTFQKAQTYKIIQPIEGLSEYEALEKEISAKQLECNNLADEIQSDLSDVSTEKLYAIADLKKQLSDIQRVKAKRQIRLNSLDNNLSSVDEQFNVDYENIQRFFPNMPIRELQMINDFHKNLTSLLTKDIKKEIESERNKISRCENAENEVVESIKTVIGTNETKKLTLDRYALLQNEMQVLVNGRGLYLTRKRFKEEMDEAAALYETTLRDSLNEVQNRLNEELNRRNDIIRDGRVSPRIELSPNNYKYTCDDDSGTGSNYRNLILFDLSVMSLTCLPILIHDTILFKHIAVDVMSGILPQYTDFESKQLFIAFDNMSNYSSETQSILNENRVISFAPNGNELFGRSWNKKQNEVSSEAISPQPAEN